MSQERHTHADPYLHRKETEKMFLPQHGAHDNHKTKEPTPTVSQPRCRRGQPGVQRTKGDRRQVVGSPVSHGAPRGSHL